MISKEKLESIKSDLLSQIKDECDQYILTNLEKWIDRSGPEEVFL